MGVRKNSVQERLIIFCRYPIPGRVKTRLIPALGPAGAADLQRLLTEKTLATAREFALLRGVGIEVSFEEGDKRKIRRWLGSGLILSPQGPGDLGERMHSAFLQAFRNGANHVVLVGTDIPNLRANQFKQAFSALKDNDLVLGPSTDGGYWLIGLRRPAALFEGINWGTKEVLEETIALTRRQGLRAHILDPLSDLDTPEDFKRLWPGRDMRRPYISTIIPTLNEETNIEATILSAQHEDVEIIVVDGGSSDHTVARAARTGVRVESSPRGRALQQNRGAELAEGSVLLFLHADTHLPDSYVTHVFDTLIDPMTSAGAFRFRSDLNCPAMKGIAFLANFRSRFLKLPYGDQGLFVRKPVFDRVGGFPDVPIAEDLFLVRRLAKHGRIRIASADVTTSARRWLVLGLLRTTLINQLIVAGCYLGVSPHTLASLERNFRRFKHFKL
ncbi:MAG: TIGR04283 family arsenosugar biosynthesis glycosyltransferase [Desulfobacteraceae bacterium]|nr:TIGR04283 family arsenosugar biosynthesis glycosyltransferase [Desulfobacteraceae bacterium]